MVHDLDPFLWQIYGDFGIRWYGLSYLMGFICAYLMISWLVQRHRSALKVQMVGDLISYVAIGTLVGGRLGYCIFYSPDLFLKFKNTFPFWGVLAVNEGGMASHGGIIGIVIATILFARRYGINTQYLLDLVAVSGPIGVFFGRIANFINGELVGRPAPEGYQLAVKFPQDIYLWPNQEFDRLSTLSDVVEKLGVTRDQWLQWLSEFRINGRAQDDVYNMLNKIVDSIQNGNTAVKTAIEPLLTGRHPSQLYAALGEGLFTFLVLFFIMRKPRKPGFVAASFVMLYAIVRISDEYFRMPDAHIGFQWLGLTRGQWLSIGMFAVGLIMMIFALRSGSLNVPGWGRAQNVRLNRK